MKQATILVIVVFFAAAAWAEDYVGMALSACSPLDGTTQHVQCMQNMASTICKSQQSAREVSLCFESFRAYHLAQVEAINAERARITANGNALIEQLQNKLKN